MLAALASLAAIIAELGVGQGGKRTGAQLTLATVTIFLSWVFIHTIFALNYAHDYYGEHGAKRSGLKFPDDEDPDYWDFVYFSFVVGMTCQVSDVAVASQPIRRTVIAHGVVSFFFNTRAAGAHGELSQPARSEFHAQQSPRRAVPGLTSCSAASIVN